MKKINYYLFILLLSVYTTVNAKTIQEGIAIELISSRQVVIKTANIYYKNDGITVSGRLKRRYATNSLRLPGHLDVEILDVQGSAIYKTRAKYSKISYLRNIRNFKYEYSIDIPFVPSDRHTIRMTFQEK
ncbi:MAG: hypothetical protein HND53_11360 [Proteobacteria bacterium]|nr:hypothetical protein [Pseudomonadota bacterium]NOG61090.1 hypothetical protein [Pseudomonadota bacterium]